MLIPLTVEFICESEYIVTLSFPEQPLISVTTTTYVVVVVGFAEGLKILVEVKPATGVQLYVKPAPLGVTVSGVLPPKQTVSLGPASTVNEALIEIVDVAVATHPNNVPVTV
jgi:hypothetical protein